MVRAQTPAVPKPVLEKMRYIPTQISGWTKLFSGKQPEAATPLKQKKRKGSVKKAVEKRMPVTHSRPVTKPKPEGKALVFFKKEPVTFRINRLEHPDDFKRIAFVIKACSNDTRRTALTVLHVEQIRDGSWLVATDGKRLHAALIPAKIRSGDYKPVVTKDDITLGEPVTGIMFPNWRNVIPGDTVQRGMIDLAEAGWGKDSNQTEKLTLAFNAFIKQTGELVNLRYLEDLAKQKWSIHCRREKNRAIMLKAENVKLDMFALIMPFAGEAAAQAA